MADDVYYLSWDDSKIDGMSKGFLMLSEIKGTIKDDSDFKDLLGNWLESKYVQYEWIN